MEKLILFEVKGLNSLSAARMNNVIEGAFASVRWKDLEEVADLIIDIASTRIGLDRSQITSSCAYHELNGCFSPSVRIHYHGDVTHEQKKEIEKIGPALTKTLLKDGNQQRDLLSTEDEPNGVTVDGPEIKTFLEKRGGKPVSLPMTIEANGKQCATISGGFAPRPNDKIADGEPEIFTAIVDELNALNRDVKIRKIEGGERINAQFSEQLLERLSIALGQRKLVKMEMKEALDAKGRKFLLVSHAEIITVNNDLVLTP